MVDLRFLRPVRPGDTITFSGQITEITKEANGSKVTVDIKVANQEGDTTGIGKGSASFLMLSYPQKNKTPNLPQRLQRVHPSTSCPRAGTQ